MLCAPDARLVLVQVAVRVFPVPERLLAAQPVIDVPPSTKLTVPVGADPVTLAVNVTLAPSEDGFSELVRPVVVLTLPTICATGALLDAPLPASPLYRATMLYVPTAKLAVTQVAVLTFPLPPSAAALQPPIVVPLALNVTVPVGALPETVAVNVTLAPKVAGFVELASVVVAGVGAVIVPLTSFENGLSLRAAS